MEDDFDPQEGNQGDPAGPAPAGDPQPPAPGGAPGGGTPPAADPAAGAGNPPKGYVPIYRLNEVSRRYQILEQEHQALLNQVRRPATPAAPAAPAARPSAEEQAIRDQFYTLFPAAKQILENPALLDALQNLPQMAEALPQVQAQQDHYWQTHGTAFLTDIRARAREAYGEDVNPRALRHFELGFLDLIESDPEAQRRYLSGDRTLVEDYWKEVSAHMVDPIRRRAAAGVQRRGEQVRRVPSPGPGTQALGRGGQLPKPKTEEELHDRAWAALEASRS